MQIFFSFFFAENVIFKGNFYLLVLKKEKKKTVSKWTLKIKNKNKNMRYSTSSSILGHVSTPCTNKGMVVNQKSTYITVPIK